MSDTPFLYDPLGPRGTRRAARVSIAAGALATVALAALVLRLHELGQLDPRRWAILADPDTGVPQTLWRGYLATLRAALIAMVLAVVVGLALCAGRMSRRSSIRSAVGAVVELMRGIPLLLLMLFAALGLPRLGLELSLLQVVVLALVAYNSAVLCEIFRGGITAIDRGQREAAAALGVGPVVTFWRVLLPQAIPTMLPVLVSQLVILLKDTSLGFIVGYTELLRSGRSLVEYYGSQYSLQLYLGVAALYIATNISLSFLAARLTGRTSPRRTERGRRRIVSVPAYSDLPTRKESAR
ncbi:amino acid ABC transporter permease [Nocardia paucivorans]|uniref:amino acid ABC transporter permease n=1 Tax=Nocardia paucivorans TaxID=114259 RepID=UPI0002EB60BD|nr:ABC transporter permease subunit [Nocardia paucivorans]